METYKQQIINLKKKALKETKNLHGQELNRYLDFYNEELDELKSNLWKD